MQEQQHPLDEGKPTGVEIKDAVATPQGSTTDPKAAPQLKPNRRMKRADFAMRKKAKSLADQASARRLTCFRKLQDRIDQERARGKLSGDQVDMVFKVALAKLFKKDFKKQEEFDCKLNAIVHNIRSGKFLYGQTLPAAPSTETVAPPTQETAT